MGADLGGAGGDVLGDLSLHASDPFTGDIIDEATAARDDLADTLFGRGGSDEVDGVDSVSGHDGLVIAGFFGGQIEDKEAVDTGGGGVFHEPFEAVSVEQIKVDVEDDGDLGGLSDAEDRCEQLWGSGAGFESALGGELIDETIGERVAKGHA